MTSTSLAPLEESLPAPKERVQQLAATINLEDPALTLTYGAQTMNGIATFADGLLSRVKAKDAGPVGDTLTDLLLKVKGIDVTQLAQGKKGFLESLPLIGSLFSSMERTVARFNTLSEQVDSISGKLNEAMVALLKDIEVLEQLYEHNKQFYSDLNLYIEAGKQRLEEAKTVELPRLQEEAAKSADSMTAQKVRDFAEQINRFERRLHDLQISRTITLQTAPQIRLIQNNDQTLAEKIQTSILTTLPIWKGQMVLALSLYSQKGAAKLQKEVSDTTNELLRKNAEMLESATVETAREVERSVVDIETLREVQNRLVSTIEQTLKIAEEGRNKRQDVEKELKHMEEDLRTRLTSLAAQKTQQVIDQASAGSAPEAALNASPEATALPAAGQATDKQ
ncbi:toxic anion resistance protein [Desulfovibrio sp. OttesenSCG-928-A18]|nr:toxic anion resistance protein [Desulfovibrio sp. OttesenSCG-928-A18]